MSEHAFALLLAIGDAPYTNAVEQCTRCGIVRVTTTEAVFRDLGYGTAHEQGCLSGWVDASTTVRWYRRGVEALPSEECG